MRNALDGYKIHFENSTTAAEKGYYVNLNFICSRLAGLNECLLFRTPAHALSVIFDVI